MKKIITLGAMLLSLAAFASPKADIEKAQQLSNENKKTEVIKVLDAMKNDTKGEENYFLQGKLILAYNYIKANDMKSLDALTAKMSKESKEVNGAYLLEVGKALISQNNVVNGFKYINKTRSLGNNFVVKSDLIYTNYYLGKNQDDKAKIQSDEALKYAGNLKGDVAFELFRIYAANQKNTEAKKYLDISIDELKKNAAKNPENNLKLAVLYGNILNDAKTALDYANKAAKAKVYGASDFIKKLEIDQALNDLGNAIGKDSSAEKKAVDKLRSLGASYSDIASILARNFDTTDALKYANMAVTAKEKDADKLLYSIKKQSVVLDFLKAVKSNDQKSKASAEKTLKDKYKANDLDFAVLLAKSGFLTEAKSYAESASKAKIQNADELLKQINDTLKNQK